jgi:phosphohistidine phosphatase
MQLFVIRHAIAVTQREGRPDAERALTAKGRKQWLRAIRALRRLGVRFDALHYSPLLRAVQTAEPLKELVHGPVSVSEHLTGRPGPPLLRELQGDRVGLVGHEPWLGQLIAWLLVDDPALGPQFTLKKGGVAFLEGEPRGGEMRLKAFLTPKALHAIPRK